MSRPARKNRPAFSRNLRGKTIAAAVVILFLLALLYFSSGDSFSSGFIALGKTIREGIGADKLPFLPAEETAPTPTGVPGEIPAEKPTELPTSEPTSVPEKPPELPSPTAFPDVSSGNESNESFGKNLLEALCLEDSCGGGASGGFGRRTNYYYSGGLAARGQVYQSSSVVPLEFVHGDYLSSVRTASNSSGISLGRNDFQVFGGELRDGLQSRYRFAGSELDSESGLYYLGARFYKPSAGRFLSADPLIDGTTTPYSYAANNPLRYIDPDGETNWDLVSMQLQSIVDNFIAAGYYRMPRSAWTYDPDTYGISYYHPKYSLPAFAQSSYAGDVLHEGYHAYQHQSFVEGRNSIAARQWASGRLARDYGASRVEARGMMKAGLSLEDLPPHARAASQGRFSFMKFYYEKSVWPLIRKETIPMRYKLGRFINTLRTSNIPKALGGISRFVGKWGPRAGLAGMCLGIACGVSQGAGGDWNGGADTVFNSVSQFPAKMLDSYGKNPSIFTPEARQAYTEQ
ncbi:MAG: RHS repeat-associated core domain-containing protein [Candidatus Micrarchaeota archaeon]